MSGDVRERFAGLLRHAELYGTEGVLELVQDSADRARLRVELDAIDAARPRRRFETHKRRRRTPDETLAAVAALRSEGLVPSAIADKLGLSDAYVRKCLAKVRDWQKEGGNPAWLSGGNGTEREK